MALVVREARKLLICGLEYRLLFATPEEVPQLRENDGWTDFATNAIYIRKGLPRTRTIDVFVHEWKHAFFEASGIGNLLEDHFKGESFERFEETLIRLEVPWLVRLFADHGLDGVFDFLFAAGESSERPWRVTRAKKARKRR